MSNISIEVPVDQAAVEAAVEGDTTVPLTAKEMWTAWKHLEARNLSPEDIGDIGDIIPRTVLRWRQGLSAPTGRGESEAPAATPTAAPVAVAPVTGPLPAGATSLEGRLKAGSLSPIKAVERAAVRALQAIVQFNEVEKRERGKAAAYAEVAELERQLKEVKAKLRSDTTSPIASTQDAASPRGEPTYREVWAWAAKQGMEVKRGRPTRPPQTLVDQYKAAKT